MKSEKKSANARYHDALKAAEASTLHRQKLKQDKADADRARRRATQKSTSDEITRTTSLILSRPGTSSALD